jgi:uncharacterized protein YbaR (Trm112 family)
MSSASDARREHQQRLLAAENKDAPLVRARICNGLGILGIELNEARNAENAGVISTDASRATVRVIRTDEELMIAHSDLAWPVKKGIPTMRRNTSFG